MDAANAELVTKLLLAAANVGLFPLVLYFIYRGDQRESKCQERDDQLNKFVRESLVVAVKENSAFMTKLSEKIDDHLEHK